MENFISAFRTTSNDYAKAAFVRATCVLPNSERREAESIGICSFTLINPLPTEWFNASGGGRMEFQNLLSSELNKMQCSMQQRLRVTYPNLGNGPVHLLVMEHEVQSWP